MSRTAQRLCVGFGATTKCAASKHYAVATSLNPVDHPDSVRVTKRTDSKEAIEAELRRIARQMPHHYGYVFDLTTPTAQKNRGRIFPMREQTPSEPGTPVHLVQALSFLNSGSDQ